MSALINRDQTRASDNSKSGEVAAISTNARIDYILRFSKQAVLVVDDLSENYSNIGSLFLGNLPEDHNAAYLAVSSKFSKIQIRCRIIEQLFSDVLFDPEQPLAVSILRLAKDTQQPISIVIDHAHLLPFKLFHELCYLAEVAKKAQQNISVVLLAEPLAGIKIIKEKAMFKQNLAIVSAQTGQLLQLDDKIFKEKKVINYKKISAIVASSIVLLSLVALAVWGLNNRELFTYSALPKTKQIVQKSNTPVKMTTTKNTLTKKNADQNNVAIEHKSNKVITEERKQETSKATASEIFNVLTAKPVIKMPLATPSDVLSALAVSAQPMNSVDNKIEDAKKSNQQENTITKPGNEQLSTKLTVPYDDSYYSQASQGYVIQLTGFRDKSAFEREHALYEQIDHGLYTRMLNGEAFTVVTSKIYETKPQAIAAIKTLPNIIQQQKPWIKSVVAIKQEITAYKNTVNN